MTSNIFIPKRLKVGFNERSDTYSKKLAYVIYWDDKGKLRKQDSWEHWRDKNIEPEEYDNTPTEGFVLNKNVGGYAYHWDARKSYIRIYDPRGFEFEITLPNLLYILENTNSVKGKGLEGEFVYGWDGKDLLLVPVCAPEYQAMEKRTNLLFHGEYIKGKDLKVGYTYTNANGGRYVYLGKHDLWSLHYSDFNENDTYRINQFCTKNPDYTLNTAVPYVEYVKPYSKGKRFWFFELATGLTINYSSVTKRFYSVEEHPHKDYHIFEDHISHDSEWSPIDYTKTEFHTVTLNELKEHIQPYIDKCTNVETTTYLALNSKGVLEKVFVRCVKNKELNKVVLYASSNRDNRYWGYSADEAHRVSSLEEMFNKFKPVKVVQYLENGNEYKWRGAYIRGYTE